MTREDLMNLLRRAVKEHGQSTVARKIGRSPSAISQILSGTYKGEPSAILHRVEEEFGGVMVDCPVFGCPIPLKRCADERRRLPRYTNPVARMLTNACPTCKNRR
jgi:transcriptional regulator with XRE-family HTH domain